MQALSLECEPEIKSGACVGFLHNIGSTIGAKDQIEYHVYFLLTVL